MTPVKAAPLAPISLAVLAALLVLYPVTLQYGFHSEDFVFFRPFQADGLWQVVTGRWFDVPGAPLFYRPLSVFVHAIEFHLFGLNAWPLHLISILIVGLSGLLVGVYTFRETGARGLAITVGGVYALHPGVAMSVGPWVVNHYHGLATLCVLWALILWQPRRDGPARGWWVLALPLVMAGLFKENALMMPPMMVSAHWLLSRVSRDVKAPRAAMWVAAAGLFTAVNVWRLVVLGGIGGYGNFLWTRFLVDLTKAPGYALLIDTSRTSATVAAGVCAAASVVWLMVGLWRHRSGAEARVFLVSMAIITLGAVPLAIVPGRARAYLVSLGSALLLGAAASYLWTVVAPGLRRLVARALVMALFVSMVMASREYIKVYAPCSDWTALGDEWLVTDMARQLPPEFVPWLTVRSERCPDPNRPRVVTLPAVTWTLPSGDRTILVPERSPGLTVRVRAGAARASAPVSLGLWIDGRPQPAVQLTSDSWIDIPLTFPDSWWTTLRKSHRVDLHVGGAEVEVVSVPLVPGPV